METDTGYLRLMHTSLYSCCVREPENEKFKQNYEKIGKLLRKIYECEEEYNEILNLVDEDNIYENFVIDETGRRKRQKNPYKRSIIDSTT